MPGWRSHITFIPWLSMGKPKSLPSHPRMFGSGQRGEQDFHAAKPQHDFKPDTVRGEARAL